MDNEREILSQPTNDGIRRSIVDAFGRPDLGSKTLARAHSEYVQLRERFTYLTPTEMIHVLPDVLIDLMETRADYTFGDVECAWNVFYTLDAGSPPYHAEGEHLSEDELRHWFINHETMFGELTQTHAGAVLMWLRLMRSWPENEFYCDAIDGAMSWWTQRAGK